MGAFGRTEYAVLTQKYRTVLIPTSRYRQGIKLTGLLYLHRISDRRVSGTLRKNFKMFQELSGERTLRNVVIVTNMWGEVEARVGEKREAELKGKDIFFKPILDKHAQMARHMNTVDTAQRILRLILHNNPLPQRIQEEIVDEGKDISRTSAGRELDRELQKQIGKHKEEMRVLEEQAQQAMKDKDEEAKKRLMKEIREMKDKIKEIENDAKRMVPDYQKMVLDLETHRADVEKKLKESTKGMALLPSLIPVLSIAAGAAIAAALPPLAGVGIVVIASTIVSTIVVWIRSRV